MSRGPIRSIEAAATSPIHHSAEQSVASRLLLILKGGTPGRRCCIARANQQSALIGPALLLVVPSDGVPDLTETTALARERCRLDAMRHARVRAKRMFAPLFRGPGSRSDTQL